MDRTRRQPSESFCQLCNRWISLFPKLAGFRDDRPRRAKPALEYLPYEKRPSWAKVKDVEEEITKAKNFRGQLSALFLATTAEHDARLQEKVRLLSDQRVAQGEFAVALLFWGTLSGDDLVPLTPFG
jgi:hypothetical protein